MDHHDIESICPKLRKFVREVNLCRPGISPEPIRIRNLKSSRNSTALCGRVSRNDRFTLLIPYCERELEWDVIFLCDRPELPPDFYFHPRNFLEEVDCDTLAKNVPSLAEWDYTDPKALVNVILEFLEMYKHHQLQLIPEEHRAFLELGMLLANDELKNKVEIVNEPDSIRSLINVSPESLKTAEDDFRLVLALRFDMRYANIKSSLQSYGYHKYWGPNDGFDTPNFYGTDQKTVLDDLLPSVNQRIETIINAKLRKFAMRKHLVFQFYITFKGSIVELDTIDFSFVVLRLSRENFEFFLRIDIPSVFPDKPPQYRIISNYCFHDMYMHERVEYNISNVKYSPDMPVLEVVKNFYIRFLDVFNNFKKTSIASLERNLANLKV